MPTDGEPSGQDPNFDDEVVQRAHEILEGAHDTLMDEKYHRTRIDDHESTMSVLASGDNPDTPLPHDRGTLLDLADIKYQKSYDAGEIDGPFEFPSVRANRLRREAAQEGRPPILENIGDYKRVVHQPIRPENPEDEVFLDDYRKKLESRDWDSISDADSERARRIHNEFEKKRKQQKLDEVAVVMENLPAGSAVIEEVIRDNDAIQPQHSTVWLRCEDPEQAARYVYKAGDDYYEPGPGEYDGIHTGRYIYVKGSDGTVQEVKKADIIPYNEYYF